MANRGTRAWWAFSGTWILLLCMIGGHAGGTPAVDVTGGLGGEFEITEGQFPGLSRLEFSVGLRGEDWHTSLRATATDGDFFSYLGFSDRRQLGPFSMQSLLVFDPGQGSFSYASNLARFELLGVSVANYAYVPGQPDQIYDQLTLSGTEGGVRWGSVARVGLCPVEFRTLSFRADWTWAKCALDLGALASFNKDDGFERFRLTATYREVPSLTFGSLITDFLVTIDFGLEEKSISTALRARTARASFCLTPMLALNLGGPPLSIDSLEVYGIKLECSIGETVEFYAATSLTDARNVELIGHADYFEVYRLRVRRPSCCGTDTRVEVALYFQETSTWLFDWGMATASIGFPLGEQMRWTLAMEFPANALWTIRVGWDWRF